MYHILDSVLILVNIDPQDFPPREQTKNCYLPSCKEHFDDVESCF